MSGQAIDLQTLAAAVDAARPQYDSFVAQGLKLDITRGKPCTAQLDLADGLVDALKVGDVAGRDGFDVRNYGGDNKGLVEIREIFSPLVGVPVDQLVVRDNSSLALMHQCVAASFFQPLPGGTTSWSDRPAGQKVSFLAPVPGYDRHFGVCAELGVGLIPVAMTPDGPDMDEVERLVAADASIKGIWCVPKYSNPTGVTFSDETVARLAAMPTAADDFRIYWDNAYAIHHLTAEHDDLADVLQAAADAGHPDRVFVFASTSKVSFAGAGISFFGSSPANVTWYLKRDIMRSIGPDKVNQLRHLRYFQDTAGVEAHMARHTQVLAPKFEIVAKSLAHDLDALGVASWTDPRGGYFVNLDVVPGTARRVVELAKAAGVALTPAGATYPGGVDPDDKNIRIAPSFPTLAELEPAMKVLTLCVVLAAGEKLLDA